MLEFEIHSQAKNHTVCHLSWVEEEILSLTDVENIIVVTKIREGDGTVLSDLFGISR